MRVVISCQPNDKIILQTSLPVSNDFERSEWAREINVGARACHGGVDLCQQINVCLDQVALRAVHQCKEVCAAGALHSAQLRKRLLAKCRITGRLMSTLSQDSSFFFFNHCAQRDSKAENRYRYPYLLAANIPEFRHGQTFHFQPGRGLELGQSLYRHA